MLVADYGKLHREWPSGILQPLTSFLNQSFYHASIVPMLCATLALAYAARPRAEVTIPAGFRKFQISYLLVWSFCVAADWLQGPFVYALYAAYGFSNAEIAQLFVGGYLSSLVFGCLVGTFSDKFGRKSSCVMYCLLYTGSCLTMHFKHYYILMAGRILGGIAISVLFSSFECWMVSEHMRRHLFTGDLLGYMFGAVYTAMYCVAIASGLLGQVAADAVDFRAVDGRQLVHVGGYCCPFDLAIVSLFIGLVLMLLLWEENYGNSDPDKSSPSMAANLQHAVQRLFSDPQCGLLCIVISAFEGAMFAFVFEWTPALESASTPPPYGIVFALFMMACMCGASAATLLSGVASPTKRLAWVFSTGLASFVLAASVASSSVHNHLQFTFFAFLLFEFCVGVYFPSMGVLKSELVPEQVRGTMYNIFRVPQNMIVVALLLSGISMSTCFKLNAGLVFTSLIGVLAIGGSLDFGPWDATSSRMCARFKVIDTPCASPRDAV